MDGHQRPLVFVRPVSQDHNRLEWLAVDGEMLLAMGPPAGLTTPPHATFQMQSAGRFRKRPLNAVGP
jgi:hypothetical protein